MRLILIIVVIALLCGAGRVGYSRYGYRGGIGCGGMLLIVLILLLLFHHHRF